MTQTFLHGWIIAISFLIGLSISIWTVKKGKSARWSLVGVILILGSITYVGEEKKEGFKEDQKEIIRTELEDRYHLSGIRIESLNNQTQAEGNRYAIQSKNGVYEVIFAPNGTEGFELRHKAGESLRGRRNVYEALNSINQDELPDDARLEFRTDDLYKLKGEEKAWTIRLKDNVVLSIVDSDGRVRYQHITEEDYTEDEN